MEISERIKQKADELFRQYGIKSVTMDEIAGKLGVSKKTIYQVFSDKDDLVDAVINEWLVYNQNCCSQYRSQATNAVHEVFLAMDLVQVMFENMNPTILYDLERNHPTTFQKFLQHKNKFLLQVIKENIEKGKEEDLYRHEVNAEVVARVRLETMMLPFNQQLFPKNKFNLVDLQNELIEYFLFGIATLKGYKQIIKYQQQRIKKADKDEKK